MSAALFLINFPDAETIKFCFNYIAKQPRWERIVNHHVDPEAARKTEELIKEIERIVAQTFAHRQLSESQVRDEMAILFYNELPRLIPLRSAVMLMSDTYKLFAEDLIHCVRGR